VIERLIARSRGSESDAAIVTVGRKNPQQADSLPQGYGPIRRRQQAPAVLPQNVDATPAVSTKSQVEESREGFGPGKVIYGQWGNGKLTTRGGMTGSYGAMPGYGKINFELGGYKGILTNAEEGVAWNPETQSLFHFKHKIEDGKFTVARFREFESSDLKNQPVSFAGEMKGNTVELEGGLRLTINKDGTVVAQGEAPEELKQGADGKKVFPDSETYRDGKLNGYGFMDKNGNLVLTFDNGGTVQAAYSLKDGKFAIHGYKNI
jgi:hypothetical protein